MSGKFPAELESEDILSGVDTLIAQGIADPDRLVLYGMSNGATAVNLILTRTHRFKAAVSTGGVSDLFNYYMYRPADDWTIPDFLDGKTPQNDLNLISAYIPSLSSSKRDNTIAPHHRRQRYTGHPSRPFI